MTKKVKNVPAIALSVFGVVVLGFLIAFVYMSLNGADYSSIYQQKINSGEITNPGTLFALSSSNINPSDYENVSINTPDGNKTILIKKGLVNYSEADIEKELVTYASVVLKLYNLHNIPFTAIPPKVQVKIDNNNYYLEISDGEIIINSGIVSNPDIKIETTSDGILNVVNNGGSITDAISSGEVKIDILASKLVLFSKGYLELYNEIYPQKQ